MPRRLGPHLAMVVLVFAGLAWLISLVGYKSAISELAGYYKVAPILASIGGAAAGADYYIEST